MRVIKLTGFVNDRPLYVYCDKIVALEAVGNSTHIYCIDGSTYVVIEDPEKIIGLANDDLYMEDK